MRNQKQSLQRATMVGTCWHSPQYRQNCTPQNYWGTAPRYISPLIRRKSEFPSTHTPTFYIIQKDSETGSMRHVISVKGLRGTCLSLITWTGDNKRFQDRVEEFFEAPSRRDCQRLKERHYVRVVWTPRFDTDTYTRGTPMPCVREQTLNRDWLTFWVGV